MKLFILLLVILVLGTFEGAFGQSKRPETIGDGFVLKFAPPYDRILIDTDEKNVPNRLASEILLTPRTVLINHKGKPASPGDFSPGMQVEIKLDAQMFATQIKIKTNPGDWETGVDGYLDRVNGDYGFVDGQALRLAPNITLQGTKEWKGRSFSSLNEIPLGSLIDVKGIRTTDGSVMVKKGEVSPNTQTKLEVTLIQTFQKGLVLPTNGDTGASVQIGGQTHKLCQNLQVNAYVNKVGNRVSPRYLRDLPADDPNRILFRFYVVEDRSANAVAFPDGSVFVNTGLLERLENEAQLAVVIGHEIAHVTNEHARRSIETSQKQAFWLSIAGAVTGQQLGMLVAQIGYGLLQNKFSRDLEDQADRVGLYYAWEAGYDVREAPRLWMRMMGNFSESKTAILLYSDHPSMLSRYRNTNRLLALNYGKSDFSESEAGTERYLKTIGGYFGWNVPANNQPADKASSKVVKPGAKSATTQKNPVTVRKPTVKKQESAAALKQRKIASVISFLVREQRKPGSRRKEDVFLVIGVEGYDYIVSIANGAIVKKSKNGLISFAEDFADIRINTMNARRQETGQGGGLLLRQNGNSWVIVAVAEGDYSCSDFGSVPQSVRNALNLECF